MIIWLASWPRSGSTFLRIVLHRAFELPTYTVYDDGDPVAQRVGPGLVGYAPLPAPLAELAAAPEPYLVKTHRMRSDDSPALVLVRDGRDAITSYAHLRASATADPADRITYREAFEREAASQIDRADAGTGSWGRNVQSWTDGPHPARAVVRYQDLIARPDVAVAALGLLAPSLRAGEAPVPSFAELHAVDPGFFRRGTSGSHRDELPRHLLDRFWATSPNRAVMDGFGWAP